MKASLGLKIPMRILHLLSQRPEATGSGIYVRAMIAAAWMTRSGPHPLNMDPCFRAGMTGKNRNDKA
ncbi:MAG: hypothetical protein DRH76_09355 [Deltaproteobacteria bacterium]|nr:MAG: hypothetical protein DRH76_09355 [Deltaproteobacteria bacterium]